MPKTDKTAADTKKKDEKKPASAPVLAGIFGLVFVLFSTLFSVVMIVTTKGAVKTALMPETPRQAYLKILGETHTGLRLARLNDFSENYERNADTLRARTGRDSLAAHEQQAWAVLTQTLYSLKSTDAQTAEALGAYKSIWGVWNRRQELPTLLQTTGIDIKSSADMFYAPNARRSQFAKENAPTLLAGEIPFGVRPDAWPQPDAYTDWDSSNLSTGYDVQDARIKFAKRPKYPRKAMRKNIEAVVILNLFIDERGNVARTELVSIEASKYRSSFTRASRLAARGSKFYPKTVGGKPVASGGYLRKYIFTVGG